MVKRNYHQSFPLEGETNKVVYMFLQHTVVWTCFRKIVTVIVANLHSLRNWTTLRARPVSHTDLDILAAKIVIFLVIVTNK